jgi:hypothetical protein
MKKVDKLNDFYKTAEGAAKAGSEKVKAYLKDDFHFSGAALLVFIIALVSCGIVIGRMIAKSHYRKQLRRFAECGCDCDCDDDFDDYDDDYDDDFDEED